MTVSNVENSLMHNTRFACRQTAAQKAAQMQRADVASRKIASVKGHRVQKETRRKLITKKYFENLWLGQSHF